MGLFKELRDEWRKSGMSENERQRYDAEQYERQGDLSRAAYGYERVGDFSRAADLWLRLQQRENSWLAEPLYQAAECLRKAGRLREMQDLMLSWIDGDRLEYYSHIFDLKAALKALHSEGSLPGFIAAAARIGGFSAYHRLASGLEVIGALTFAAQLKLAAAEDHRQRENMNWCLLAGAELYVKAGNIQEAVNAAIKYMARERRGTGTALYSAMKGGWTKALLQGMEPEFRDGQDWPDLTDILDRAEEDIKAGREADARCALELCTRVRARLQKDMTYHRDRLIKLWTKIGDVEEATALRKEDMKSHSWEKDSQDIRGQFMVLIKGRSRADQAAETEVEVGGSSGTAIPPILSGVDCPIDGAGGGARLAAEPQGDAADPQDRHDRQCPRCSAQVELAWVVCPECDAELQELRCSNARCGRPVKAHWKRCPVCQTEIS